jgi:pilus assembly protein CpaC
MSAIAVRPGIACWPQRALRSSLAVLMFVLAASSGPGRATGVATATASAAAASTAAAAAGELPARLELFVGDSRVLQASTTRIAVGNGKVLSASPVNSEQVVLIGQAIGESVVQFWLADGRQHRMSVTVGAGDIEALQSTVADMLDGVDGVSLRVVGRRILLEGDAADSRARERAAAVAALYPQSVIDFVGKVGWETMVHVDVRIVEFRRGQLRELGIRWRDDAAGPSAGVIADFVTNDRFRVLSPSDPIDTSAFDPIPGHTAARAYLGISSVLESRLRALENAGEASLVAEPRLSCRSGGTARFVAGGEIPIPIVNGVGATDVEFREYGVILEVKPVVDANDGVSMRVETELSQVDNSQRVAGIPGLLKRRSVTDLNVRSGETVVLAGLIQQQQGSDTAGIPGLSRLPVAGRLFGVRGKRIEESEVVIFLTPRIARHGEAMHGMGERLQDEVRGFEDRRNASGLRLPARQMAPQRVPAGVGSGTGSSRKSY